MTHKHSLSTFTLNIPGLLRDFILNDSTDADNSLNPSTKRKHGDLKPSSAPTPAPESRVDMYAGGKTAAEVFAKFNDNLRSSIRSTRSLSTSRKDRMSKRINGQGGGNGGGGGGGGESGFFSGDDKDRPSMAIICQQV